LTIYIDASEQAKSSRLPAIKGSRTNTMLESLTGCDIMISTLTMPCTTEALVRKHVEAGALLVQRKSLQDLVRSIGDRINHSLAKILAKMRSTGASSWQCILLSTGFYAPSYDTGDTWVGRLVNSNGHPDIAWQVVKWNCLADSKMELQSTSN
jgi:ERCC4-type nuclease